MYTVEISLFAVLITFICFYLNADALKRIILNIFNGRPTWKVRVLKFLNPDFCDVIEESGSSFFCKCLEQSEAPGDRPGPSDQGEFLTCTVHAVAKCVVSAMDRRGIDVKQDEILNIVQDCIGTTERIWPTSFDGKLISVEGQKQGNEASTIKALIMLNVSKVKFSEMKNSQIPNNSFEYVLCTTYISNHDMHSVYIEEKDDATNHLKCINSWGSSKEARPVVLIGDPTNKFFRVKITSFEESESSDIEKRKQSMPGNIDKETRAKSPSRKTSSRKDLNMNCEEESMEQAGAELGQAQAQVVLSAEAQLNSTDGGIVNRAINIILKDVNEGGIVMEDVKHFLSCLNKKVMGTFVQEVNTSNFKFNDHTMREILKNFLKEAYSMSEEEKVEAFVKALRGASLGYLAYEIEEACKGK